MKYIAYIRSGWLNSLELYCFTSFHTFFIRCYIVRSIILHIYILCVCVCVQVTRLKGQVTRYKNQVKELEEREDELLKEKRRQAKEASDPV